MSCPAGHGSQLPADATEEQKVAHEKRTKEGEVYYGTYLHLDKVSGDGSLRRAKCDAAGASRTAAQSPSVFTYDG